MKGIKNINELEAKLNSLKPKAKKWKFTGKEGILRTKLLLTALDNPQEKIKVIHVAGTAGKGSTSFFISTLLHSLGNTVGLMMSPNIESINNNFYINLVAINDEKLLHYASTVFNAVEKINAKYYVTPTYFEVITVMAFYIFSKESIEFAVIETGLGGLLDATNTVENKEKVSVITRIDYDHQDILGNSLTEITLQKAGIINKESDVITIEQPTEIIKAITNKALENRATLHILKREQVANVRLINQKNKPLTISDFYLHSSTASGNLGDETANNLIGSDKHGNYSSNYLSIKDLDCGVHGIHQTENLLLALQTVYILANRYKFYFNINDIRKSLRKARLPFRFEHRTIVIENTKYNFLLDGAHNPIKMKLFIDTLSATYPERKFIFLVGLKQKRHAKKMLQQISRVASKIIIAPFNSIYANTEQKSLATTKFSEIINTYGSLVFSANSLVEGIHYAQNETGVATTKVFPSEFIVATGSFYLLQDILKIAGKR